MSEETIGYNEPHAIAMAIRMQKDFALSNISGHRVGCCLVAVKGNEIGYFAGCNLEVATSFIVHAERVALTTALAEGFTELLAIYVTSEQKAQATLCGYCRQDYMYINPSILVNVLEPDGTVGIREKLIDTMKFPYVGTGKMLKQ